MSSKKYGNKTTPTTTATTMSKPAARKRVNELNVDRNKTKNAEKNTKKSTNEDETKNSTRPIIKTKDTTKKLVNSSRKLATTTAQKHPTTPPSSRVIRTQFFPSKSMYSQALKKQENKVKEPAKNSTTKKTSTINKNRDISPDSSSISERPRTATLRKGSIVNQNIAGPEVPKAPPPPVQPTQENPEIEDNYDDDFDSYESDFDEYHSSDSTTINISEISTGGSSSESEQGKQLSNQKCLIEDEKKLDSGTYELPEFKQKPSVLNDIKEIIENETAVVVANNFGSLSDEGFEDAKSLQFINFLDAQKKSQRRKTMEMKRKRGEEILSMIKLDVYSFTLLDLQPVPYDVFIKTYGKQNTIQISTQTGDDDLNEETQTDCVDVEDKWTQYPPVFVKINPNIENFWSLHRSNCIGVGGDSIITPNKGIDDYNLDDLNKFMVNAGNLILNIQIENGNFRKESGKFDNLPPFSRNCILYETQNLEILKDRSIINAYFSTNRILTIHTGRDDDQRSIICVWRIGNVEEAEFLLNAFGEVTSCTSDLEASNLIFAGSDDGTVAVWDVKEDTSHHAGVLNSKNFQLRTPTFTTEIHHGHNTRIVSVLTLSKTTVTEALFDKSASLEICSLDEGGELIIWGVIRKNQQININNHGLAYWGNIVLTINTRISLQQLHREIDDFKCTDLLINYLDPTHLYISTNYGFIIHCLANNAKPKVRKFLPKYQSKVNCLEMCPFSSKYFIAAFDNGNLNFYTNQIEQPLMILSDKDCTIGRCNIDSIQWSHNRPLIFYIKDITNTVHVWDLNVSDMFPVNSTPFNDGIVSMKLSPNTQGNNDDTYMMIATKNGTIYLYLLASGHEQTSLKQYEDDLRKFYNYIERYV